MWKMIVRFLYLLFVYCSMWYTDKICEYTYSPSAILYMYVERNLSFFTRKLCFVSNCIQYILCFLTLYPGSIYASWEEFFFIA